MSPTLVDFGGTPPVAEIRDHRFYDERAAANLSSSRGHRRTEDTDTVAAIDGLPYGNEGLPYANEGEGELVAAEPESNYAPPLEWAEGSGRQPAPQDEVPPD